MNKPFACILGLDGSGKTTAIANACALNAAIRPISWHDHSYLIRALPGFRDGEPLGYAVERADMSVRTRLVQQLIELELDDIAACRDDQIPLIDSYWYRFAAKARNMPFLSADFESWCRNLPQPTVCFFIDTPVNVCLERKPPSHPYERGPSNHTSDQFYASVRNHLLTLSKQRLLILDGTKRESDIAAQLADSLREFF